MRIGSLNTGLYAFNLDRSARGNSSLGRGAASPIVGLHRSAQVRVQSNAVAPPPSSSTSSSHEAMLARINSLLRELRHRGAVGSEPAIAAPDPSPGIAASQATADTPLYAGGSHIVVTGANDPQIARVDVGSLGSQDEITLQGQVTRAAESAVLTIVGGTGARATSNAYYELTGSLGSARVDLVAGESLYAAAQRISRIASSTGVLATVQGDNLVLSSTLPGTTSSVQLRLLDPPAATATGVNHAQIDSFTVVAQAPGTSDIVTGTVISSADRARLVYSGAADGKVAGTASFQLSGSRGSTQIALTAGESLGDVASRINQASAVTGVVASLDGTDLLLSSDSLGAAESVRVDMVDRAELVSTLGVDSSQISEFVVSSIEGGAEQILTGEVFRSASHASLTLQGTAAGEVVDTATFELTGSLGTATISIEQGESLGSVAGRINALTGTTGVTARVAGDQLVLESSDVGSAAQVAVQLRDITHTNLISGVNAQQLTSFQVDAFSNGASKTLSGTIDQTAGIAELSFEGLVVGSLVGTTATFTLSGSQGSSAISVSSTDTLSVLADRVNQRTATTGVAAVVVGNQVKFRSVGVGSGATVAIDVTSGSFHVSGGNGDGTANGSDARATVNGQAITGSGNTFHFSDAVGTYTFTSAGGFTGSFDAVSITSLAGEFEIAGGNGDGTASGLDATAAINGVQLTGVGNRFTVTASHGTFQLEVAAGFEGALSPVTVRSTLADFEIQGGDGSGTDTGSDFEAIINGVEHRGTSNHVVVSGDNGTYEIVFGDGFQGELDAVSVVREDGGASVQILGGDEQGRALGTDAVATINGSDHTAIGGTFVVTDGDGAQVTIEVRPGFAGEFDIRLQHVTLTAGDVVVPLSEPAAVAQPVVQDAHRRILDEIDQLVSADKGTEEAPAIALSDPSIRARAVAWQRAALAPSGILDRYSAASDWKPGKFQVVRQVVDFLV